MTSRLHIQLGCKLVTTSNKSLQNLRRPASNSVYPLNNPLHRSANTAFIRKARQAHFLLCVTKSPPLQQRYRRVLFTRRNAGQDGVCLGTPSAKRAHRPGEQWHRDKGNSRVVITRGTKFITGPHIRNLFPSMGCLSAQVQLWNLPSENEDGPPQFVHFLMPLWVLFANGLL